jgi:hypothetical protein
MGLGDHRDTSLRFAYADPPYPGNAERLYGDHPDYAGEVDHRELLLELDGYDAWALSTSADALPFVVSCAAAAGLSSSTYRVAVWLRGGRPNRRSLRINEWEPVLYRPARVARTSSSAQVSDVLEGRNPRRRTTHPAAVIGAKPPDFCAWLFELCGLTPADELSDLFPGSGGVARSWAWWCGRDPSREASRSYVALVDEAAPSLEGALLPSPRNGRSALRPAVSTL